MSWSQFPFVRLILPFVIGIVVAFSCGEVVPGFVETSVVLLTVYIVWVFVFSSRIAHRSRWVSGLLMFGFLWLAGFGISIEVLKTSGPQKDLMPEGDQRLYMVKLLDDPVPTARSFKSVARIVFFQDSNDWKRSREKVMLYFEKDSCAKSARYGEIILLNCVLKPVSGPSNPEEFNYQRHLKFQGIYRAAFVKKGAWQKTGVEKGFPVLKWSREMRRNMLRSLKESGIHGKEFALAAAILLGYDGSLDDDQRRQFAGAGAMHVLCVSGLHVGIIAMVLSRILFLLDRNKWGRFLKLVLLVGIIWLYAAVTGFSPSVMRASTMFSFIYMGKSFRRNISIYNMLAASAFLLLMIEPRMLVQLGFQLSYLAVLGIVLLFKPIHSILPFLKGILDKVWQITAVSIAATATTFPLSLFYFHQFPNLFWLTNLVAIPAAFLIVYLGIAVLSFSFFPDLSVPLGKVLNLILNGLNRSVGYIEGLPFATTQEVFMTPVEFLVLMSFVFVVVGTVVLRKRKYVYISLLLIIVLLSLTGIRKMHNRIQKKLIVYDIPGHSAYEFVWSTQSVFIGDSLLFADSAKIGYAVNGFRTRYGIRETECFSMDSISLKKPFLHCDAGLVFFGGRTLILPKGPTDLQAAETLPGIDLVILSGQYQGSFALHTGLTTIRNWVFDSSVPPWKQQKWKDSLDIKACSYHDINTSGAFVYTLE